MARITGIGGVFLRTKSDEKSLAAWYQEHLGMKLESWGGAILRWPDDQAEDGGLTVWHLAAEDSKWFAPSTGSFMINYRVDDMNGILRRLKDGGVPILKGPEHSEEGTFAWIVDPDGNKVELWKPKARDAKAKPAKATKAKAKATKATGAKVKAKVKATKAKARATRRR
ncbi:MAG: glyoxalase [Deltaproteobacteria bacterium RBG_16_71_12]|nr:MAG: glyoxalase [Deltaproteobacteria bacterium RBG_16_71_12]